MIRRLLSIVALFVLLVPQSQAAAGSVRGSTVLRLRGSFVPDNFAGDTGPGWSIGGGAGRRLNPAMLLTANYERIDFSDWRDRLVQPMTLQLETRLLRKGPVAPHVSFGAGVYRREQAVAALVQPVTVPGSYGAANPHPLRESIFGFTYGIGLSSPISNGFSVDLGLTYHQLIDRTLQGERTTPMSFSTVGAGLSYALR